MGLLFRPDEHGRLVPVRGWENFGSEDDLIQLLFDNPLLINSCLVGEANVLLFPLARGFRESDAVFMDENGLLTVLEVRLPRRAKSRHDALAEVMGHATGLCSGFTSFRQFAEALAEHALREGGDAAPHLTVASRTEDVSVGLVNEMIVYLNAEFDRDLFYEDVMHGHSPYFGFPERRVESGDDPYFRELTTQFQRNLREGNIRLVIASELINDDLVRLTDVAMAKAKSNMQVVLLEVHVSDGDQRLYFPHLRWTSFKEYPSVEVDRRREQSEQVRIRQKLAQIREPAVRERAIFFMFRLMERMRVPLPSRSLAQIPLVPKTAYFTFDPEGKFAAGMYRKLPPSENPCRVVLTGLGKKRTEAAKELGFELRYSRDRTQKHMVLELDPGLDDEHLERVADLVAELGWR